MSSAKSEQPGPEHLLKRLEDLESALAFTERDVEALTSQMLDAFQQMRRLSDRLDRITSRFDDLITSLERDAAEEPVTDDELKADKPPHSA